MSDDKLFAGQVAIVTGAGGGIGREEAIYLAARGAKVVINDAGGPRDGSKVDMSVAESVASELSDKGYEAIAAPYSVADLDGAEQTVWTALNKWGRVDILVNNAGILRDRSLTNMTAAEWDAVIAVHLRGSFLMTRAFARALKMQVKHGVETQAAIVNTTSLAGLLGNFGQANYSAAKAGLYGLTRTASMEFSRMSCRVNAIAPIALTRMTEDVAVLQSMGIDEMGPEHVAPVVAWLCSSLSADVNGRIFGVHGKRVFEYAMNQSAGLDAPPSGELWTPESLQQNLSQFAL